ncbi:MAG: phosphate ABC transporter substrate-binding protein PstS [Sulfuricella sp.]|nr:phosphate ABC transporter substrate-binding protein PstS [Sulfuricella sp.]
MNKSLTSALAAAALAIGYATTALAGEITGAGATFPYPIYAKWAEAYKAKTGVGMNYQSIGSGGGIKQIKAKTVDFGASDKPLKLEDLEKDGLMQFPAIMGGVVPVINVEGIASNQLKLTGPVLADIFLGKIKKWNDPAIVAQNKGVNLPGSDITVVHRSDGSGTTFVFTNYLAKVSAEWKDKVGNEASVAWPVGTGGKGNEGVANFVKQIKGSIGYVESAYAKQNKMTMTMLQNKEGQYVIANDDEFKAAAANAHWDKAPGFYEILTEQPGKNSWPITGASFILMHKNQANPAQAAEVLKFFDWAFANGEKMAAELDYVPMPGNVVKLIQGAWKTQLKGADGKPVYH